MTNINQIVMSKREIRLAFKRGLLDEVKNQLLRYGKITGILDIEEPNGCFRLYEVLHEGLAWEIQMNNGEVTALGWEPGKL